MTAQELKDKLTVEDVERYVCQYLGSDEPEHDNDGNPIFQTVCHNHPHEGSHKLYYYVETQMFHCYTHCGDNFDIFELTIRAKGYNSDTDFYKSYNEVDTFFGYNRSNVGFTSDNNSYELTGGWDLLQKVADFRASKKKALELPKLSSDLLEYFGPRVAPREWLIQGISADAMYEYNIRVDSAMKKIVIPHYDIDNNLCGIRGRSFNPIEIDEGKKYMPIYIEQECYNHPLGSNLYGLSENKDVIRRLQKVVVYEAEKSVMLTATYYNKYSQVIDEVTGELKFHVENHNFSVASCGSSFSLAQLKLLLKLGVKEIIFCYDKENDDDPDSELSKKYLEKLLKIALPLAKYVDVYIVMDHDGLLGYKDSPADRGKEILEKLMKNKKQVKAIEADTLKGKGLY